MATDEARLAEIQARLDAATPGPWHDTDQEDGVLRVAFGPLRPDGTVDVEGTNVREGYALACDFPGSMEDYEGEDLHNAAFLAHSRDDIAFLLAQSAALRDQLARVAEALVEERARGNWGAEGNIDWEDQAGYSFGYGTDEIGVQDFYRRDARKQLAAEALAARTPTPGAAGEVG